VQARVAQVSEEPVIVLPDGAKRRKIPLRKS
jgi:hypothetical protein